MADQEATKTQGVTPPDPEAAAAASALLTDPEPDPKLGSPAPEEPEDWRAQAIKTDPSVRARFDQMMFGQQAPAAAPPPDPVALAQKAYDDLLSQASSFEMTPERNSVEDAQRALQFQREISEARISLETAKHDAQLAAFQQQLMPVRAEQALSSYVARAKRYLPELGDPENEAEFKDYIRQNNIDPQLIGEQAIMDHLAKSVLYERSKKGPKKVKAPAPALDESYAAQGQQARAASEAAAKPRALTENEMAVANFFHMKPEDYVDPKYGSADDQGFELDGVFQISNDRRAG